MVARQQPNSLSTRLAKTPSLAPKYSVGCESAVRKPFAPRARCRVVAGGRWASGDGWQSRPLKQACTRHMRLTFAMIRLIQRPRSVASSRAVSVFARKGLYVTMSPRRGAPPECNKRLNQCFQGPKGAE